MGVMSNVALRSYTFLFKEQRAVNLSLIQALRESLAVNQNLAKTVSELQAELYNLQEQVADLNAQMQSQKNPEPNDHE